MLELRNVQLLRRYLISVGGIALLMLSTTASAIDAATPVPKSNMITVVVSGSFCGTYPEDCLPGAPDGGGGWGSGEGGGGGGGAGASSAGFPPDKMSDDGTRGKAMNNNRRTAGCLDEVLFSQQTVTNVGANGPVGTIVPIPIGDPMYADPGWHKWQTETIKRTWNRARNITSEFRIQIHYMYNDNSGVVQQVKFKNSFEYGCLGIKVN